MLQLLSRLRTAAWATSVIACALTIPPSHQALAQIVGFVERKLGEAIIASESVERAIADGTRVRQGDILMTGDDGRLTVIFSDGSRLGLGAATRVVVVGFTPEQGRSPAALMLALEAGSLRLVSEPPVRAPHRRVEVRSGTTSVSATAAADIWCGLESQRFSVLVVSGRVRVGNWAGSVIIDRRRAGTEIADVVSPPEPVYGWERERIRRVLATVGAD